MHKCLLKLALGLSLLLPYSICGADETDTAPPTEESHVETIWVWSENTGSQHAVLLSKSTADGWTEAEQISDNNAVNVVPAVAKINSEDLIIIWSSFNNGQSKLLYKIQEQGKWGDETPYYTGLSSNTAPTLAVDRQGKIWLVWAGFNGVSDEIFYTTWEDTGFGNPVAITSNTVPDILPVLGLDTATGLPWIQWQTYTQAGYVDYQSFWEDGEWSEPLLVSEDTGITQEENQNSASTTIGERNALVKKTASSVPTAPPPGSETGATVDVEIEIPEFIQEPDSASLNLPGYEIQSLPVRSMIRVE